VEENRGGFPWWLLLLPLLAIPFFFLRGRDEEVIPETISTAAPPPPPPPPRPSPPSRVVFVPRDCRDGYAYWEVPEERKLDLRNQGGRNLALRLYDTTGINLDSQEPTFVKQIDVPELDSDLHVSIPTDDRHYLVELGYTTPEDGWLSIAKSDSVHVPACPVEPAVVETTPDDANRLILVARNCREAYAYWEITDELKERLRTQGGEQLKLKLYDTTNVNLDTTPAHSTEIYGIDELDSDQHIPIPLDDRDYVAELGYLTVDGNWLSLARSLPIHVPPCPPPVIADTVENFGEVLQAVPTTTAITDTVENFGGVIEAVPATTIAENYSFDQLFEPTIDEGDITLVSTTPGDGLVSWRVSEAQKAAVRSQGGERLALRIYDMTNADSNDRPDSVWEYECNEADEQKQVRLYAGDRFYVAELGYISPEGRWLALARSHSLWVDNITTEEAD